MHCAVKSTPQQNVVNVICIIVQNVLTRTLVGRRLFIEQSCLFNLSEQFLLPSAVHLEERLTVSQQLAIKASSQPDIWSDKQAGRQKHTAWVFSMADLAASSGESSDCQNKEWSNGNAANHKPVGRSFESRSTDRQQRRPTYQLCPI